MNEPTQPQGYASFNPLPQTTSSQQQVQNQYQNENPEEKTTEHSSPLADIGEAASDLLLIPGIKQPNNNSNVENLSPEVMPETNFLADAGEAISGFFEGIGEILGGL